MPPNWTPIDPQRVLIKTQESKQWSPYEFYVSIQTITGPVGLITSNGNFDDERQALKAVALAEDGQNLLVSLPDLPFNESQKVGVPRESLVEGSLVA